VAEKVYAPMTVKTREGRFGEEFRIGFNVAKMREFIDLHENATGYVNLQMTKRRDVGKFGETHTVTLDTWSPTPRTEPPSADDVF